jgi:ubiquinone/menaquinone biosynthesis C-methylase UbiE
LVEGFGLCDGLIEKNDMTHSDPYFLGYASAEQQRLQQQAVDLAEESAWLFDQIGLQPGSQAVEIGCGPQGCLELLSRRVGPTGSVIGVEVNEQAVVMARRFLADHQISNVEVRQGDARATRLPREAFDLVTARLVLVNVPEPDTIVAEMAALVRPGGVVALHEADSVTHLCDPPLPAWDRLQQVLEMYARANQMDSFIGRRTARMLMDAGLCEVQARPLIHIYGPTHSRRRIRLQFVENLRDRVLAEGLISETELDDCIAAVERHLDDPATMVISHLFIQAWGRKP